MSVADILLNHEGIRQRLVTFVHRFDGFHMFSPFTSFHPVLAGLSTYLGIARRSRKWNLIELVREI